MGHFERGISTALCIICLLCGVLLAVLGIGGSYGEDSGGLILGALLFLVVPSVMLFAMYGGGTAKKTSTDPVGIVAGAAMALIAAGTVVYIGTAGLFKEAGPWLLIPAAMFAAGVCSVLKAAGVLKKKK